MLVLDSQLLGLARLRRTYGHVQQLAGADNAEQAIDVVEHDEEHLGLCGGCWLQVPTSQVSGC